MRILQAVTLVSSDGAFGGPLTVAVNQSSELIARGNEVLLFATARGLAPTAPRDSWMGVPAMLSDARRVLPGFGFSGLTSPAGLRWLRRNVRRFDIVHVHLARDLVTLPAALIAREAGVPYVVQCHGMVDPSPRMLARALDRLATRRVLADASDVLFLTDVERSGLKEVADPTALRLLSMPNGVPFLEQATVEAELRPEVLFCARLHPRKRPTTFVEMARLLVDRGVDASFAVCGPDEGERAKVERLIHDLELSGHVTIEGAIAPAATTERLGRASVYVLPSIHEPFPMTILEAMALGVPVVSTDSCGLAADLAESGAGLVTDGSPEQLAEAVGRVLAEPELAARMSQAGREQARTGFGMGAVVDQLESVYERAAGRPMRSRWEPRPSGAAPGDRVRMVSRG